MFLDENSIKKLDEADLIALCELISYEKLKNIVIDYHKSSASKGKSFGKDDKRMWKNINNSDPGSHFIYEFFIQKLLKEDKIDKKILEDFETKYLKAVVGKEEYKTATREKVEEAINNNKDYSDYERNLLRMVIGDDVSLDDIKDQTMKPAIPQNVIQPVKVKETTIKKEENKSSKGKDPSLEKIKELQLRNKKLQDDLTKVKKDYDNKKEECKAKEKELKAVTEQYSSLKKKLENLLSKEKVELDLENKDFDKDNLPKILQAIEEGYKAKDYKAMEKLFVKAYIILGVVDGGKR